MSIKMIVSRLIHGSKLVIFYCNDLKYSNDSLNAGAIGSFRVFLQFNEL